MQLLSSSNIFGDFFWVLFGIMGFWGGFERDYGVFGRFLFGNFGFWGGLWGFCKQIWISSPMKNSDFSKVSSKKGAFWEIFGIFGGRFSFSFGKFSDYGVFGISYPKFSDFFSVFSICEMALFYPIISEFFYFKIEIWAHFWISSFKLWGFWEGFSNKSSKFSRFTKFWADFGTITKVFWD